MLAVSIRDLSWRYSGRRHFAIENMNLDIEENTFVSIVGPNESGKTTLVSCIKGLIPNNFHGVWRGTVEVFGKNVREKSAQELAREIGFVFADPEAQFTSMTVEEELVFGLENIGLPLDEIDERLRWVSKITMIEDLFDKSPYEISGGQKQRVAIASVVAMKPRILILDEPTSMVDPLGKDFIFQILTDLKREENLTLIVVEHNIEQIAPLSDVMVLVHDSHILKVAPPAEFFEEIAFLREHDIQPPEVTVFADHLKQQGLLEGPLPISFEEAVATTNQALSRVAGQGGQP